MILKKIQDIKDFCPVCNNKLCVSLFIKTFNGNSHIYTLINDFYPLEFKRLFPLGDMPENIYIDDKDYIKIPDNIEDIRIKCCCNTHYNMLICWSILVYDTNKTQLSVCESNGEIMLGEFKITNGKYKTNIYKKTKGYNIYNNKYKLLFSIQPKPYSYWPLHNKILLEEKINKLVLLK